MRDHRIIVICLSVAALIATAWLFARAEPARVRAATQPSDVNQPTMTAKTPATAPTPSAKASPTAELVQKIRRQIGSPLDGSVFESPGANRAPAGPESCEALEPCEFRDIYERVACDPQSSAQICTEHEIREPSWGPRVPGHDTEDWAPESGRRFQQSLRDAARQLEATAADLEDAQAYEDADALRRWAKRLRLDARSGESTAASAAEEIDPFSYFQNYGR